MAQGYKRARGGRILQPRSLASAVNTARRVWVAGRRLARVARAIRGDVPAVERTMTRASTRRRGRGVASGVRGSKGPAFKKPKKVKMDPFVSLGAVLKVEKGGIVSDPECVYVGHHSLPAERTFRAICMAIVRMCARKAEQDFNLFDSVVEGGTGTLIMQYQTSPGGALSSITCSGTTWQLLSDDLYTKWIAISDDQRATIVGNINFYTVTELSAGGSFTNTNRVTLRGADITICVAGTSNMQIQNRTQSAAIDGANRNAVEANPVRGKVYETKGSAVTPKWVQTTTDLSNGFFFDSIDGQLQGASQDASFSVQQQKVLRKPPLASFFEKCSKSAYVSIQPGMIRRSKCSARYVFKLNTWMEKLKNSMEWAAQNTGFWHRNESHPRGQGMFYGLEKLCDTGSTGEGATPVTIGYEIITTVSAYGKVKPYRAAQPVNYFS